MESRHRRWQTFEWEMTHVAIFSRRIQHSGDTSFKLPTPRRHWGTDPDGKGKNISTDTFYRNLGIYNWGWVNLGSCHEQPTWIAKLTLGMAMRVDFIK